MSRAKTASAISVTGAALSSPLSTVHLPVPFWPAGIEDLVHEIAAVGVLEFEDIRGDLDQVGIEFALVPFRERRGEFLVAQAESLGHQVVGLRDELHVAVLNAVVDHLDEVARAAFADPVATRNAAVDHRRDRLEDGFDVRPRLGIAAGHEGRAVARAFLTAGDAGADKEDALFLELLVAAHGVLIEGVAAIDDDVAPFSSSGTSRSMNSSTGAPALTSIMTRRGFFSRETISSRLCAPRIFRTLASLARKSSTFFVVRL